MPGDPSRITIRPAGPGDAGLLAELGATTFRDTFGAHNRPEDLEAYLAASFSPAQQAAELASPGTCVLLAEHRDQAVGYAQLVLAEPNLVGVPGPSVEIRRFYVVRAWQGRGLAQRLMAASLDHARQLGGRTVWLGVWQHNARAIAFYEKCGFRIAGTQEFRLGADRQTDWVMVLDLSAWGQP